MRNIVGIFVALFCIGIVNGHQNAWGGEPFDSKRYENIWRGTADWLHLHHKTGKVDMVLTIAHADDGQVISWEINGKTLEHVDYQYLVSKFSSHMSPVLCVYAQDGKNEHTFCGMLYSALHWDDQIRGIYELVFPCQVSSGKLEQCVQHITIELQAKINKYDGRK